MAATTPDDIRHLLKGTKDPEARVDLMNQLSRKVYLSDIGEGLSLARAALRLANANEYPLGVATAYIRMADCHRLIGDAPKAHQALRRAEAVLETLPDAHALRAYVYRGLAGVEHIRGNAIAAVDMLIRAIAISREHGEQMDVAAGLAFLGDAYRQLGDYERAIASLIESRNIAEALGQPHALCNALTNLACVYGDINDDRNSVKNFEKALKVARSIGLATTEAVILNNLATLQRTSGDIDRALGNHRAAARIQEANRWLHDLGTTHLCMADGHIRLNDSAAAMADVVKARELFREIGSTMGEGEALMLAGHAHLLVGEDRQALDMLEQALDLAGPSNNPRLLSEIHEALVTALERLGRAQEALDHFRIASRIRGEIHTVEMHKAIASMQARDELARKEKERELLQLKVEQLQREVALKSRELMAIASSMARQRAISRRIHDLLSEVRRSRPGGSSPELIERLRAELASSLEEDQWQEFEAKFNEVHPGFFQHLLKSHPGLTPTELRVCSLIRLGHTTKEIADILFTSNRTVDVHRLNLRKKLGLAREENLITFLASMEE